MKNQTPNAGILQGKTAGLVFLAFFFLIIMLTSCKKKQTPVIDPAQIQKEFVQNLTSYPAPDFTKALAKAYTSPGEYTITKLSKGAAITYRKESTTHEGNLETDLYCLKKPDGLYLPNGIKLLTAPAGQETTFRVTLFPQDHEWSLTSLIQITAKYPLTVMSDLRAVYMAYELPAIWDPEGNVRLFLREPIPGYTVETATDFYLFGKELQPWHTHEQVTAALKK